MLAFVNVKSTDYGGQSLVSELRWKELLAKRGGLMSIDFFFFWVKLHFLSSILHLCFKIILVL